MMCKRDQYYYRQYIIFVFLLSYVAQSEDTVTQPGQPTHFHMEDRGPEIQVTADDSGVKINARPAGLNVVAKPGQVPYHPPVFLHHDDYGYGHYDPKIIHHDIDPVAYHGHTFSPNIVHHYVDPAVYHDDLSAPKIVHHDVDPVGYGGGLARVNDIPDNPGHPIHPGFEGKSLYYPHHHHRALGYNHGPTINNFYNPLINWHNDYYDEEDSDYY